MDNHLEGIPHGNFLIFIQENLVIGELLLRAHREIQIPSWMFPISIKGATAIGFWISNKEKFRIYLYTFPTMSSQNSAHLCLEVEEETETQNVGWKE